MKVLIAGMAFFMRAHAIEYVQGPDSAPVTMVVYTALSCGHCAHFHRDVLPKVIQDYVDTGKVRLILRDYPLDGDSLKGAQLTWCGGMMRYPTLQRVFFESQERWITDPKPEEALLSIAAENGLGLEEAKTCLLDEALRKEIVGVRAEAQNNYHIDVTPAFVINAKVYKRYLSFEEIQSILGKLLPS